MSHGPIPLIDNSLQTHVLVADLMLGDSEYEDFRPSEEISAIVIGWMVRNHVDIPKFRGIARLKGEADEVWFARFKNP